jgi:hypothetical protein
MATGPKKGMTASRKRGSGPDNKGLSQYTITSAYATDLGAGDLVQRATDGSIQQGINGGKHNVGCYLGCQYTDTAGDIKEQLRWAASTVATDAVAKVMDDPMATYTVVADGSIATVDVGDWLPVRFETDVDSNTGRSNMEVRALAQVTSTDIDFGDAGIAADIASSTMSNADTFTVGTGTTPGPTTITISTNDTTQDLLDAINAATGVSAELNEDAGTGGHITIKATDGSELRLANGTGAPLEDMGIISVGNEAGVDNELRVSPPDHFSTNRMVATGPDLRGSTDLGADHATITDTDAFSVTLYDTRVDEDESSAVATTVTIANLDGTGDLLSDLNAVPGLTASLEAGTGFLVLETEKGVDIELVDGTGTPLTDAFGLFIGRTRSPACAVKVEAITDTTNNVLEVSIL